MVNFRLTARGILHREAAPAAQEEGGEAVAAITRQVWFEADRAVDTPVYDRRTLRPGMAFAGPAVVEELDSTTIVFPGDGVRIDAAGNMIIALGGAA